MNIKLTKTTLLLFCICCADFSFAQQEHSLTRLTDDVTLRLEASTTQSTGSFAPLWLSSNRQGIVSPYGNSAYERVGAFRPLKADSLRKWKIGYGVDLTLNQNAQSAFFIHQAYAEINYKKATLTIGSKEREIDLRNNSLTSGGLSQGINAQPIPEILFGLDYFNLPYTKGWVKMKARLGYGTLLDGNWQKDWVGDASTMKYSSNMLYHEKAAYLKFGKEDSKVPLTLEAGVQFYCLFGGTHYNVSGRGHYDENVIVHSENLSSFWHAFLPFGSSDVTDGTSPNAEGNHLGSYNMALTWHGTKCSLSGYYERFFEDQSQLFLEYGIYDHLVGVEFKMHRKGILNSVVIEHLSTKDQSSPVFHDKSNSIPVQISGKDDYYNHNIHVGWQYYGMALGHPLLTSPIYNASHSLVFYNNRVTAWHFGFSGSPTPQVDWRMLLTLAKNFGSYSTGIDAFRQTHLLAELTYRPSFFKGWTGLFGIGYTGGKSEFIDKTTGVQLTVRKEFKL